MSFCYYRFTSSVTVSFNLIPYNDKWPVVMPQYSDRNFTEESAGVMVFATVSITDADEECENNTLQFAHITLYDADDGEDESISVRHQKNMVMVYTSNILYFRLYIVMIWILEVAVDMSVIWIQKMLP